MTKNYTWTVDIDAKTIFAIVGIYYIALLTCQHWHLFGY